MEQITFVITEQKARMCNAQIVLRKHRPDGFKDKMLIAKNAIVRKSKVLKVCKAKRPIIKLI